MNQASWQKIEELFNDALEITSEKRSEFLEAACIGESELKDEVAALLAKAEREDSFLENPALSLGMTLLHREKGKSLLGEKIGRYKIGKLIGEGGMGEVYLAEDLSLNRPVALKVLPEYLVKDEESIVRFQKEALAASAISHPNIAHIYEAGIEENRRFISMEYVEGITLRNLLKQKNLDVLTALDIALQTANAVSAAHSAGIIHRDIKPENLMLRTDGFVKVLDFGVAKLSEVHQPTASNAISPEMSLINTTPGMVMGTIGYISPEQLQNKKVDVRADIWSLGIVLYEMLAGQKPFEGKTAQEIGQAILKDNPVSVSLSTIRSEDESSLQKIITKSLQKNAVKRYESASDLAIDLKAIKQKLEFNRQFSTAEIPTNKILSEGANTAGQWQNSTFLTKTKQFWNQQSFSRKGLLVATLIGVLTFGIGLSAQYFDRSYSVNSPGQAVSANPEIGLLAVLPFENETGDEEIDFLSKGLADDLIRNLGQANIFSVVSLSSAQKIRGRNLSYDEIKRNLKITTVLEGKVKSENGLLFVETRLVNLNDSSIIWQEKLNVPGGDLLKLRNALTLLLSNKMQEGNNPEKHLVYAEYPTGNNEAYRLYLEAKFGRKETTVNEFKRLIGMLEKAVKIDPKFTLALVALAENYNLLGTFMGQSPEYYQPKAKEAIEKALELDDSLSEAHTLFGKIKMDFDHDWTGCEREFKRAIQINPNNELAHHWYGEVYLSAMKRLDEAVLELEISQHLNPLSSGILTGLAWVYIGKGNYQKAIDFCDQAYRVNPEDNDIYHYRAQALFKLNRFDQAVQQMDEAIKNDPDATRYYALKAVFLASAGRFDEAKKLHAELKNKSVSKYSLAIAENAIGNRDQAFDLLNQELQTNSVDLLSIEIDPILDSMRDDARFMELERKLKLR